MPADVTGAWPWLSLAALGAFHGLNPAMGWLFAVGLGLQEGRRRAVYQALVPIAVGHALSIAAVVAAAKAAQLLVEPRVLRFAAAALLLGFGAYQLLARVRHRALAGMRVSRTDLAIWSFITLASADKRISQVIERGRTIRFGNQRLTQDRNCFGILTLLCVELAKIDIRTYVIGINA